MEFRRGKLRKRIDDNSLSRGANWAAIIGIPIGILALVLAYFALDGGSEGSPRPAGPAPRLERVDLSVSNDLQSGAEPALEFLVHNGGRGGSVISRAQIEILSVTALPLCYSQGDLPESESYGAQLPADADSGEVVEVPLHQQLLGNESDRFAVDLGVIDAEGDPPGQHLFELSVSLIHDGDSDALPMGTALVSVPGLPIPPLYYLREGELVDMEHDYNGAGFYSSHELWHSVMPCWRANGEGLIEATESTATRSPDLDEILRSASVGSYAEVES